MIAKLPASRSTLHDGDADGCARPRRRPPPAATAIHRAGCLTPYTAQTIVDDALRAGRGTRVDVTVPPAADDAVIEGVRAELGRLAGYGIGVDVRRALVA